MLVGQQAPDTPGRVAAGFGRAPVAVEDSHGHVRRPGTGLEQDQLIEADARATLRQAHDPIGRGLEQAPPRIDDDEVVAEPVHLCKRDGHVSRAGGEAGLHT